MATATAPPASCMSDGCATYNCLTKLWEWIDLPLQEFEFQMDNKKPVPTHQALAHHIVSHHVHPEQIYSQQPAPVEFPVTQPPQLQPSGVMHQLMQRHPQYHSTTARSPLLENQHDIYGTNKEYARNYNVNYNCGESPPDNINQINQPHKIPKGYNEEVYQDYIKRNPKDTNQIYQNHQAPYRSDANQCGFKPYLSYSNRIGPQSNTELLKRQYNEIQQMKLQQQMLYQNQAQMHQQQKFAERQILQQQLHGVQPPMNLQNSYFDTSCTHLDQYSNKHYNADIQKDIDRYTKNNEYSDIEKQKQYQNSQKQYPEPQWNQPIDYMEADRYRKQHEKGKTQSDYIQQKNNAVVSPVKSSDSSTSSIRSPSSESRRQALRSPIAQRQPAAPVMMAGILYKQGSDGLKVFRKRWFVLSEYCLFYYKSQDEEKLLGSVLLPSYRVSACTAEDKVLKKFAFKLEHANMRTYVLAAPDQENMMKWVKALTMAALMQSPNEQPQRLDEHAAAKLEESEVPGPTYANAPPKPRRSNEGYYSPSPERSNPNYEKLKKPSPHNQASHFFYQEPTYGSNQEGHYSRTPLTPPTDQEQPPRRAYDAQHLSLPLINTVTERLDKIDTSTSSMLPNPPYFDKRRTRPDVRQELYDCNIPIQSPKPFLQDTIALKNDSDVQMSGLEHDVVKFYDRSYQEPTANPSNMKADDVNASNIDMYGELRQKRSVSSINERMLVDRRTPDAYARSAMMACNKGKDYEDIYGLNAMENEYKQPYAESSNTFESSGVISANNEEQYNRASKANDRNQENIKASAALRRKKMKSSGAQPPFPRPHSADFLEYEAKLESTNNPPVKKDPPQQPRRPKSSLDINSYYDLNSDRYYSEESYAEKMRQSAQYMHQVGPRNIQFPLAKYASGLAEKQLYSPYPQKNNNNYEMEFNYGSNPKYGHVEGLNSAINSNWTLKEKAVENQKNLNRSSSAMSDGSNLSAVNDTRFDPTSETFMRSASARLPSTNDNDKEKKVHQREESMKRLLEWKQRMLQSPLTRKSTPATTSLARSLNESRQSLRSYQYKPKSSASASYHSYSSDDEEETTGTDLQKPREMQAGRFQRQSLTSPNILRPKISCAPPTSLENIADHTQLANSKEQITDNTYENIEYTDSVPNEKSEDITNDANKTCHKEEKVDTIDQASENDQDDSETQESEAESEQQFEYTDNDLDEVLLESDIEVKNNSSPIQENELSQDVVETEENSNSAESLLTRSPGEDHYLPMSPRKMSTIEPAHKTIIQNLSVFNESIPHGYEDNPYVEMNVGKEEEDTLTYEIVCVNNGKVEPVYMELSNLSSAKPIDPEAASSSSSKFHSDTVSNFADTKDHTLKRASKDKSNKEKLDCADSDGKASDRVSLDSPFSRLSISDTFRPASYYLGASPKCSETIDSSDSEIVPSLRTLSSTPPCDELSDQALSKYILDKIDTADMSHDNSILRRLTSENQTTKRKTVSLMIYGSRTSIHDTLSRGEKIRNTRASLASKKINEISATSFPNSLEQYNSSKLETDSLPSNTDRGSSRQSLESDISSKFETTPSNVSSEVSSLNESDPVDFKYPRSFTDVEMTLKRRPLSDDVICELFGAKNKNCANLQSDKCLDNLQLDTSTSHLCVDNSRMTRPSSDASAYKDNIIQADQFNTVRHIRSSSTPVSHAVKATDGSETLRKKIDLLESGYSGSQSFSGSGGLTESPISYYCKDYGEEKTLSRNLNNDTLDDKIKEFDSEKLAHKSSTETNASCATGEFQSRVSSTEHTVPYYYSELSSQEHINLMPISHYLKNTNVHRKLNNQRRRRPFHKKADISHIHNPIRYSDMAVANRSFDLAASARSVSVEFLSAADKNPEIDMKNIYQSSGGRNSKIPESMNLMSGLGCKRSSRNLKSSSPDLNITHRSSLNTSLAINISNASMSSHCSGNSTNTVYYDAEAEAIETHAYENVMCQSEKHWDEDTLWRDNLRRVSHRHARSMNDLDVVQSELPPCAQTSADTCCMNSIKRVKKTIPNKMTRDVTYVNCDIQNDVLRRRENSTCYRPEDNDDDVYVSLIENLETMKQSDEGVYELLAVGSSDNSLTVGVDGNDRNDINRHKHRKNRRKFEIDREKLRQWDLMSSGLMKAGGVVRGSVVVVATRDAICGTDSAATTTSDASMTTARTNLDLGTNDSSQQTLSKKSFAGSNISMGRHSNIPVRAVSPRVRWTEENQPSDSYESQQISNSQQNDYLSSIKKLEHEESLQRLEQLRNQLLDLEKEYERSKPLVQLVGNMFKMGPLCNRPEYTAECLERNQRLRQKVLSEHAVEQQRWLESAAAGRPLETEAARARVAELWALEQELADEASILQGLRMDRGAIESFLTGVRGKQSMSGVSASANDMGSPLSPNLPGNKGLELELVRKLEQIIADNARPERELQQLRQALQARKASAAPTHATHPTAVLEDEVTRVQQLFSQLQRQRQELSLAVRNLTQQSYALQVTQGSIPEILSNAEKQEIKTVRIVKRESERRQRDRDRQTLQPVSVWPTNNITVTVEQHSEEEPNSPCSSSREALSRTEYGRFDDYYKPGPNYMREPNTQLSPKYTSSPSLSNYDYSCDYSPVSSSYNPRTSISASNQYLYSPTTPDTKTLNDPVIAKASGVSSRRMELSPIFKSEAAKQIITEMSRDSSNASAHRRQVPKEKRRHHTAPHHLNAKALSEMPKDTYNSQDKLGRCLDDADLQCALRAARSTAPDVVRSAMVPTRYADSIDQLLAAPQKILIPERFVPEKPPELSPEEQRKRLEKVESIKKMLSGSSADPSKSPEGVEKKHREHLLQMNQILAKQVTEMSKIIAAKALDDRPNQDGQTGAADQSPDVELPIYQQRLNFYS